MRTFQLQSETRTSGDMGNGYALTYETDNTCELSEIGEAGTTMVN